MLNSYILSHCFNVKVNCFYAVTNSIRLRYFHQVVTRNFFNVMNFKGLKNFFFLLTSFLNLHVNKLFIAKNPKWGENCSFLTYKRIKDEGKNYVWLTKWEGGKIMSNNFLLAKKLDTLKNCNTKSHVLSSRSLKKFHSLSRKTLFLFTFGLARAFDNRYATCNETISTI